MSLQQLREDIVKTFAETVGEVITVRAHGGRFDLRELQAVGTQTPSVHVACLGVRNAELDGGKQVCVEAQWGAFAVVKGNSIERRDAAILCVVDALLKIVPGQRWGNECATSIPLGIRADNLFSRQLDSKGIAIWGITWTQKVDLVETTLDELVNFERLIVDYDMVDDVTQTDATDRVELETT